MDNYFWVGPILAAVATVLVIVVTARASTRAQARRRANRLDLPPGWESVHSVPGPYLVELRPAPIRRP